MAPDLTNKQRHENSSQSVTKESQVAKRIHVETTINGEAVDFLCEARQTLLEVLRDTLGLTGSKEGCGNGNCGACTVLVDGQPVDSCLVLAVEAEGAEITTIEGIARDSHLHPIQQCFLEDAALQCGVCTPGFIMSAKALLDRDANPSEEVIRFQLAGNLCRCTGYDKIIQAVQDAAKRLASGGHKASGAGNGSPARRSTRQVT
jgi:carbon-monoxide dehydrogenase small subunit